MTFNTTTKALTATILGKSNITVNIPYPSQVNLSGAGTVSVSGTYPNLTITGAAYNLPPATTTTLGGIQVGSGLSIDGSGVLSANAVTVDLTPYLRKDQNLADVPDKASARTNLGLATVASTGNYNDLINRPVIPTGTVTNVAFASSDFTISGSPITTAGTITANIGLNKVTFAKFQQINTQRLIGRSTAGTGNVEEIKIGAGLSLSGGILSATGGGGTGDGTVTSVSMVSSDFTISGTPITTAGTITANIGLNKVTFAKFQQINTQRLIGRSTAGAGNVEEISIGAGLTMSSGILSATGYSLPIASAGSLGGVRVGSGLSINSSTGVLSATPYTLPIASAATLGGIRVGAGLAIDGGGILSATNTSTGTVTNVAFASSDFTISGSPITTAGTITANIANNAVTFAKFQQVNTQRIIGRSTAGTGNVEEIQIGAGLSLSGGILSATGGGGTGDGTVTNVAFASSDFTISGSPITTAGTITANIANNAVTFAKFQQISTARLIGRSTAGTGNVEQIAIGTGLTLTGGTLNATPYTLPIARAATLGGIRVGAGLAIDGSGILSATNTNTGTVTNVALASSDFTISGSPITTAGTITANIGLNKVTFAKFQQINTQRLIGRSTLGTGNVEEIQIGAGLQMVAGILSATGGTGTVTNVAFASSDFTISGSPITTAGTITANIANNAVTFAKMQQIPNNTLMGRYGGTTGNPQAITLGTGLSLSAGGILSATNTSTGTVTNVAFASSDFTISGSPITTAGTITANIGLNKVTFAKFQQINTQRIIGRSTAGTGNVEEIAIGAGLTLSAGTLSATVYSLPVASAATLGGIRVGAGLTIDGSGVLSATNTTSGTVTSVAFASSDFTISGSPITSAGTITANIANNAVTFAKFQQISTARLIGRSTAGTGNVEQIQIGAGLSLVGGVLSNTNLTTGTVTSVGISMPAAFTVSGSPVTGSGTLSVSLNGNTSQYVRGDGILATMPNPGEVNTMSNIGTGEGALYASKSGANFNIRSIKGGGGVTVTTGANEVTITAGVKEYQVLVSSRFIEDSIYSPSTNISARTVTSLDIPFGKLYEIITTTMTDEELNGNVGVTVRRAVFENRNGTTRQVGVTQTLYTDVVEGNANCLASFNVFNTGPDDVILIQTVPGVGSKTIKMLTEIKIKNINMAS